MEREVPTYYAGDRIVMQIDVEHRVNFRQVLAMFWASESSGPAVTMRSSDVRVQKTRPDGTKRSVVHFDIVASGEWLLPGVVFELAELSAETVGELAGEGKRGSRVEFEISSLAKKPSFRYENEAGQLGGAVLSAALL